MLKYHIQTIEVGATAPSSISFNSIPQTYDDLLLVLSGRANASGQPSILYRFNNSSSGYSGRILAGYTSGVTSGSTSTLNSVNAGGDWGRLDYEGFNYSTSTANTFSNIQFYIPNYKSSNVKTGSADIATEDVSASPLRWWLSIVASLWSGTQPITSVSFALYEGSFAQYSSVSLYGIKRGADGKTEIASGGTITTSGGYTIHTFTSSGTFTANSNLDAEYLVIGGGGGGGQHPTGAGAGGGGAGGYRSSVTGESSGGGASAESPLTLTAGTSYLVTVGAGGAAGSSSNGANGTDSAFGPIYSYGGGGGARGNGSGSSMGTSGGSGGGSGSASSSRLPGQGTPGQGFAGGVGAQQTAAYGGAGGGGAGAAGSNGSASGGAGGAGVSSSITGSAVARGGGGGGATSGTGGTGGGGNGGTGGGTGQTAGSANTGGGGGAGYGSGIAAAGGSGVVIIRYRTPA